MRIISKFKDYYDSVQAYGQDRDFVYVRTPKVVQYGRYAKDANEPGKYRSYPFLSPHSFTSWGWSGRGEFCSGSPVTVVQVYTIGFCGKFYQALQVKTVQRRGGDVSKICYKDEEVDAFLKEHMSEKLYNERVSENPTDTDKWSRRIINRRKWYPDQSKKPSFRWCGLYNADWNKSHVKKFYTNYCPVILGDGAKERVTYNAILRPTEFIRIFDPYRAFQEISMFLGSIAVPQKEIPHVPDETMAEIKGFDKFSFRKEPSKRK